MNEITEEELNKEILKLESEIEFEEEFHKIVRTDKFKHVFNDTIFGSEMIEISNELCLDLEPEREENILEELRLRKLLRKYLENRFVKLDVARERLSEAKTMRTNILKPNNKGN